MKDLASRFPENPLLMPKDLQPEVSGLQIISLLNPVVFRFQDKTWLLVRVAEGTVSKEGVIYFPVLNATGNMEVIEVPLNDLNLISTNARVLNYKGLDYLTTTSHLRLCAATTGFNFMSRMGINQSPARVTWNASALRIAELRK